MNDTKIVCTLGPASSSKKSINDMIKEGMSVARINASHGKRADRRKLIEKIRTVEKEVVQPVAIMLDLSGPEIRTADVERPIILQSDSEIQFLESKKVTPDTIGLTTSITEVKPGDRILLDDGRIVTTVTELDGHIAKAAVNNGGELRSQTGVNIPGVNIRQQPVTEDDQKELNLVASHNLDFVAASFVRDKDDVLSVNQAIEDVGENTPVIAKIERPEAVDNVEGIIDVSYGVMIARGDLGVECPMEKIPIIQKKIIRRCRMAGTPVITATEMLDSMIHEYRPTRAETSDVANAILDGSDAVMLSGETAVGDHPLSAVKAMNRIAHEVEKSDEYEELREKRIPEPDDTRTEALARSARYLARDIGASAIVVTSESGYTALKAAKFRPSVPIIAFIHSEPVRRQLALSGGVIPTNGKLDEEGPNAIIEQAVATALETRVADSGDTVIVLAGMMTELEESRMANMLKVHVAAETLATGRIVVKGITHGPLVRSKDGDLEDIPKGSVLVLDHSFDGQFSGNYTKLAGIIDARPDLTSYPAMVARELSIPMVSDASISNQVEDGSIVTVDGNRGVIYDGKVLHTGD